MSALQNVSLAGPTLFGPVISTAAQIASQSLSNNQQKYYVLLIVTVMNPLPFLSFACVCLNLYVSEFFVQDGVITDLQETKDALVHASDLPLSILIVGVGGADFKEMEVCWCIVFL